MSDATTTLLDPFSWPSVDHPGLCLADTTRSRCRTLVAAGDDTRRVPGKRLTGGLDMITVTTDGAALMSAPGVWNLTGTELVVGAVSRQRGDTLREMRPAQDGAEDSGQTGSEDAGEDRRERPRRDCRREANERFPRQQSVRHSLYRRRWAPTSLSNGRFMTSAPGQGGPHE